MINKKIYYYIRFKLESPLSIGNGIELITDHDCIRNNNGEVFIPATSIAGVFSHYLDDVKRNIFAPKKTFYSKKKNDHKEITEYMQSPYFISDAILVNDNPNMSIRDGVKLTENKTAEKTAKYDFEIVETGTIFDFRIELTIRENNNEAAMKEIIDILLNGLNSGEILLGFKSKRGYGKVSIEKVGKKEFTKDDLNDLLKFEKYALENYESDEKKYETVANKYDYIEVDLKQVGGLSIRRYSAVAGNADFEHIKSGNVPVIPGTSWDGLIRKQVKEYVEYLKLDLNTNFYYWFGQEKNKENKAIASNIIIEESKIKNSKEITLTRNRIDRFSGGAADRALFTEKAVFNGETKLGIKVKKNIKIDKIEYNNENILGLIALALKDIDNGLIALGGQTSVGRGIFKIQSLKLNNEKISIDDCINKIQGGEHNG